MGRRPLLAKLSVPRISRAYPRTRLFKQLDKAHQTPVIWISAPAGAGKTTLVASYFNHKKIEPLWYQVDEGDADLASFFYYLGRFGDHTAPERRKPLPHLTPEYLAGLPVFTRNFFRELYGRIKLPGALVFDNFQQAGTDIALHAFLPHALEEIPAKVNVIIISRSEPPASLARLQASGKMTRLDWGDLRLTDDESISIGRLRSGDIALADDVYRTINARSEGWVTGLVLHLERHRKDKAPAIIGQNQVFEYFAGEIFDRLEKTTQSLLLHTAFLPKVSSTSAGRLAPITNIDEVLQSLVDRNYFTIKHEIDSDTYEYHALFREFLRARARNHFASAQLDELLIASAQQLEEEGYINDAIDLLQEANQYVPATRLILEHAPSLLQQGRTTTLGRWIERLPQEIKLDQPWVQYWHGLSQISYNPAGAREILVSAYEHFKSVEDMAGQILSWSAIIDTYFFEFSDFRLDRWIEEMDEFLLKNPELPSPELQGHLACGMFVALMFRRPGRADLRDVWEPQVRAMVLFGDNLPLRVQFGNQLIYYYLWFAGNPAGAKLIADTLRPLVEQENLPPLILINWHYIDTTIYLASAQDESTKNAADKGLALADQTGVKVCEAFTAAFAFYTCVSRNDLKAARKYLERIERFQQSGRYLDVGLYNFSKAYLYFVEGRLDDALAQARLSLEWAEKSGAPYFVLNNRLANALFSAYDDRLTEALTEVNEIIEQADRNCIATIVYNAHLVEAEIALENGDMKNCVTALGRGLKKGCECGLYSYFWWRSNPMSRLLTIALNEDIEPDYVRDVITRRSVLPPDDMRVPDTWPFPVKIHTLGRFGLMIDGEPVVFKGKVQKKPLELLKVLIAYGGHNIGVTQLCDALWADAEGDAAYQSFTMALQRLRKLLKHKDALVLSEGKLSLDASCVWVDTWAFELGLDDTDLESRHLSLALYRGSFLENELDAAWALSAREHLQHRFLRALSQHGESLEKQDQVDRAISMFERGLEADPLSETFYQGLMRCNRRLGNRSEAMRIYERCKEAMYGGLGVEPSDQTQAIYNAILKSD